VLRPVRHYLRRGGSTFQVKKPVGEDRIATGIGTDTFLKGGRKGSGALGLEGGGGKTTGKIPPGENVKGGNYLRRVKDVVWGGNKAHNNEYCIDGRSLVGSAEVVGGGGLGSPQRKRDGQEVNKKSRKSTKKMQGGSS